LIPPAGNRLEERDPMSDAPSYDCFVSVNPDLRSRVGHPYHLDSTLRNVARGCGLDFVTLGHREQDESTSGLEFLRPVFSATAWEVFFDGSPEARTKQAAEFREGLAGLRRSLGPDARILVYWYMGNPAVLRELARDPGDAENVVFCLHLFSGFFYEPGGFSNAHLLYTGLVLDEWQKSGLAHEVVADSDVLIRDLERLTGFSPRPVPAFAAQDLSGVEVPPREEGAPVRIVYPTDDSPKRGFDRLLRFLEGNASLYEGSLEFAVRAFPAKKGELAESAERNAANVEVVTGRLEEEEFLRLLAEADVVILPYLPELFYYRTSSILYEAMTLRKPVIVIDRTWLASEVEKRGGGWAIEPDEEGFRAIFDELARRGREWVEEKAGEITAVPQVGELFSAILGFPYGTAAGVEFRPRLETEDIEVFLRSEIEKAHLHDIEKEIARLELIIEQTTRTLRNTEANLQGVLDSKVWRYTEPLRKLSATVKEWKSGRR